LVGQLGGKPTPACGFAMGVERLVTLVRESGGEPALEGVDVYLVHQGEAASRLAPRVAEGLRDQGIDVVFHCGGGSFKSQMKKADASGAAFAVIIGDDEANAGEVTLKPLRTDGETQNERSGGQKRVSVDSVADEIMNSFMDWEEV
jgi:histidyl-tRNA synthetase